MNKFIDWSKVDSNWKYFAIDKNGFSYLFSEHPHLNLSNVFWGNTQHCKKFDDFYLLSEIGKEYFNELSVQFNSFGDWRDTLEYRFDEGNKMKNTKQFNEETFKKFITTLSTEEDEWWMSPQEDAENVLDQFLKYINKVEQTEEEIKAIELLKSLGYNVNK